MAITRARTRKLELIPPSASSLLSPPRRVDLSLLPLDSYAPIRCVRDVLVYLDATDENYFETTRILHNIFDTGSDH